MLKRKELELSKQCGRDIEVLTPTGCLPMQAMMALKTGKSSEQGRTNRETTPTHMVMGCVKSPGHGIAAKKQPHG